MSCVEDSETERTLQHLYNEGHRLVVSLTVLGELTAKCIPDRRDDFDSVLRIYSALKMGVLIPTPPLRECCKCIQDHLLDVGRYGASASDITHFAYSVASQCDYYVTSPSEVRTLAAPCGDGEAHADCEEPPPKVASLRAVRRELLGR